MKGGSRLSKVILYSLPIIILILFSFAVWIANNPQAGEQYCQSHKTGNEECSYHNPGAVAALWIVDFLNLFSPAITALSGIAVAGFTYALWVSTEKMWKASLVQAEIAKRSFDSADRPWVLFHLHVKSVEQTQYGTLFKVNVTAQNYGKVPAIMVHIRTGAIKQIGIYTEGGIFDPTREQPVIDKFYEQTLSDGKYRFGSIIGSGNTISLDTGVNFPKKEDWPKNRSGIWLPPIVCVSITYRSPEWEPERLAQTAATYMIGVTDGTGIRGLEELTVPDGFKLTATDSGGFSRVI